jgi:hypothetical protein
VRDDEIEGEQRACQRDEQCREPNQQHLLQAPPPGTLRCRALRADSGGSARASLRRRYGRCRGDLGGLRHSLPPDEPERHRRQGHSHQ